MATERAQKTRDIPRDKWMETLDSLSREHRGDTVTVQFTDPELGYQVEMTQIPLVGLAADLHAGGGARVEVTVGHTDFHHTMHSVFDPRAVRLEEDEQGRSAVLEVESGNGGKTLVILRPSEFGEPGALTRKD
jgi:hypothetical protein